MSKFIHCVTSLFSLFCFFKIYKMLPEIDLGSRICNFECPRCSHSEDNYVSSPLPYKCKHCKTPQRLFLCRNCNFDTRICAVCDRKMFESKILQNEDNAFISFGTIMVLAFVVIVSIIYYYKTIARNAISKENYIEILKENYPSQSEETWFKILSILDTSPPKVKSLILLHGEDKKTSDCLVKSIVTFYTRNEELQEGEVIFGNIKKNVQDYGEVLEAYRPLVKKHRVLVTDLNKVSASIARVFHTLCDEVSSDIKPSLFLFTLKIDDSVPKRKNIEKATYVLKQAWSELKENEMFPLLSRVVKNVVDVIPEEKVIC